MEPHGAPTNNQPQPDVGGFNPGLSGSAGAATQIRYPYYPITGGPQSHQVMGSTSGFPTFQSASEYSSPAVSAVSAMTVPYPGAYTGGYLKVPMSGALTEDFKEAMRGHNIAHIDY